MRETEGRDVGAEPEDGVWWTYPEDGRAKRVLGPEMPPRWCKLTKLTLQQILGKPRSIQSLLPSLFTNAHKYNFCMLH